MARGTSLCLWNAKNVGGAGGASGTPRTPSKSLSDACGLPHGDVGLKKARKKSRLVKEVERIILHRGPDTFPTGLLIRVVGYPPEVVVGEQSMVHGVTSQRGLFGHEIGGFRRKDSISSQEQAVVRPEKKIRVFFFFVCFPSSPPLRSTEECLSENAHSRGQWLSNMAPQAGRLPTDRAAQHSGSTADFPCLPARSASSGIDWFGLETQHTARASAGIAAGRDTIA